MADPFSVAGSAVGVVSLSIQVCKDLVWYIDTAKDATNRILLPSRLLLDSQLIGR